MPRNKNVGKTIPTVTTILVTYIAAKKRPVSSMELSEVAKRERDDLLSKDIGATVRSILLRDQHFVRTSRGMYDIKRGSVKPRGR